jgi:RNA polymerase sigma factor (sigma-70 family)
VVRLSPSIVLLRTQSDERLTALAREGSEPAFTALVERYRRTVLRACGRVLPEGRAEDATQQTFVAAWKALTRGDDVRDVRPWLLRIARNTALNALRTPGYEYVELAESLQGGAAPQAELERRDVMRQTLAGLAALPENQREALLRSAVQGAAHADIARDLGITEGATRQLVLRARASLRSAATALTPLPLVNWAAAAGTSAVGGAFLAKSAAVVIIGGAAVATPAIVREGGDQPAAAQAAEQPAPRAARDRPARTPDSVASPAARPAGAERAEPARGEPGRGSGDDGSRGPSDHSGPGPGRETGGDDDEDGSSGPGSGGRDDDDSGGGDGGRDDPDRSRSGHSGPGGGDDGDEPPAAEEFEVDSSGPGSGGSTDSEDAGPSGGGSNSGPGGGGGDDDAVSTPTPVPTTLVVPTATVEDGGHSGPGGGGHADELDGEL